VRGVCETADAEGDTTWASTLPSTERRRTTPNLFNARILRADISLDIADHGPPPKSGSGDKSSSRGPSLPRPACTAVALVNYFARELVQYLAETIIPVRIANIPDVPDSRLGSSPGGAISTSMSRRKSNPASAPRPHMPNPKNLASPQGQHPLRGRLRN
jgi:hypothetical protein